jgi:copper chaperone CopZ
MGIAVTVVIVAAVAALALYAVRHVVRIASGKDSCCGGGGTGEQAPRRRPRGRGQTQPQDSDPSHYPFETQLTVRGMSCEGCASAVADALNALPGTWATVDLATRTATVRTKEAADTGALERAVEDVGYSVIRW